MVLRNPGPGSVLIVSGLLPPSARRACNALRVECDGHSLGLVRNYSHGHLEFGLRALIPRSRGDVLHLRFSVEDLYHPREVEGSPDRRGLGFALFRVSVAPVGLVEEFRIAIADALRRRRSALGEWLLPTLPQQIAACRRRLAVPGTFFRKPVPDSCGPPLAGLSIAIIDTLEGAALDACLSSIRLATEDLSDPVEVIVISARPPDQAFRSLPSYVDRKWVRIVPGTLPSRAFGTAIDSARHDWIYAVGSGYVLNRSTLREALRWRAPHVFAVGSALAGSGRGWICARVKHGLLEPEDRRPDGGSCARGALGVREDAALYSRRLLRKILAGNDPYGSGRWSSLERSVRAWKMGYETIFCPASSLHAPIAGSASDSGSHGADALRFLLRNTYPGAADLRGLAGKVRHGVLKARTNLPILRLALSYYVTLLREAAYPFRALPLDRVADTYYVGSHYECSKPGLIVVSPYVLFPPAHGSAVGATHLLRALEPYYSVHLVSDESDAYGPSSLPFFSGLSSVRLLSGRREDPGRCHSRIARIESHSHSGLRETLRLLVSMVRPRFVQIEHIELAKLIEAGKENPPLWILNLHDVFLSEEHPGTSAEDRYELDLIDRYDALVCCSREDASLLGRSDATVVPNAVELSAAYQPSPAAPRILFVGPSRSPQNVPGIMEFLDEVYPLLLHEFNDLELWIVGGKGAQKLVGDIPAFRQRGVRLFEFVDSVEPLLRQCALTINPIRGNRGSCRKVAESLAAGRVCVSTRDGARGYLDLGFPSLLICESVRDFTEPLRRLLRDVVYRRDIERLDETQRYALSWESSQQKILGLYSALERKLGCSGWEERWRGKSREGFPG